jgi:hypothetical protein
MKLPENLDSVKPKSSKNSTIKYKYGITIDEYNEKLIEQSNCCAICEID